MILSFHHGQSLIINAATSDFAQEVFILCPELPGYLDATGSPTHRVAILRLSSIFQTQMIGGITAYTIIYNIVAPNSWEMGNIRNISFMIGDQSGPFPLPLVSAVNC